MPKFITAAALVLLLGIFPSYYDLLCIEMRRKSMLGNTVVGFVYSKVTLFTATSRLVLNRHLNSFHKLLIAFFSALVQVIDLVGIFRSEWHMLKKVY